MKVDSFLIIFPMAYLNRTKLVVFCCCWRKTVAQQTTQFFNHSIWGENRDFWPKDWFSVVSVEPESNFLRMSEVENRSSQRREPMELYRPGALSEERDKHRRRAHFGENRTNHQHQDQPQRNGDEGGGGSNNRRGPPRGRGEALT